MPRTRRTRMLVILRRHAARPRRRLVIGHVVFGETARRRRHGTARRATPRGRASGSVRSRTAGSAGPRRGGGTGHRVGSCHALILPPRGRRRAPAFRRDACADVARRDHEDDVFGDIGRRDRRCARGGREIRIRSSAGSIVAGPGEHVGDAARGRSGLQLVELVVLFGRPRCAAATSRRTNASSASRNICWAMAPIRGRSMQRLDRRMRAGTAGWPRRC